MKIETCISPYGLIVVKVIKEDGYSNSQRIWSVCIAGREMEFVEFGLVIFGSENDYSFSCRFVNQNTENWIASTVLFVEYIRWIYKLKFWSLSHIVRNIFALDHSQSPHSNDIPTSLERIWNKIKIIILEMEIAVYLQFDRLGIFTIAELKPRMGEKKTDAHNEWTEWMRARMVSVRNINPANKSMKISNDCNWKWSKHTN